MTGHEVDGARRRQRLAVRVAVKLGQIVTGVGLRVPVYGVVVKDTKNLCHVGSLFRRSVVGLHRLLLVCTDWCWSTQGVVRYQEPILTTDLSTSPRFILSRQAVTPPKAVVSAM